MRATDFKEEELPILTAVESHREGFEGIFRYVIEKAIRLGRPEHAELEEEMQAEPEHEINEEVTVAEDVDVPDEVEKRLREENDADEAADLED